MDENVVIIPARGGSKRLPRKNILPLNGKPLIAYSIEAAFRISRVSRVIVSTDDEEIAEVAKIYGAEVPFLRPKELSTDDADISHALAYTRRRLLREQGLILRHEIILYPTSPFRRKSLLEGLVNRLCIGHKQVLTVTSHKPPPFGYFYCDSKERLQRLTDINIQPNLCSYCRKSGYFIGYNYSYPGLKAYLHILDDPFSHIDIDEWDDFYLAEELLKQALFDFES